VRLLKSRIAYARAGVRRLEALVEHRHVFVVERPAWPPPGGGWRNPVSSVSAYELRAE
jgi:hypothetical protein